jgi:hypothetical protein
MHLCLHIGSHLCEDIGFASHSYGIKGFTFIYTMVKLYKDILSFDGNNFGID